MGDRYRVGRSWGVTVVRERPDQPDQLVGTMQRPEDAQLVVNALRMFDRLEQIVQEIETKADQGMGGWVDGMHEAAAMVRQAREANQP